MNIETHVTVATFESGMHTCISLNVTGDIAIETKQLLEPGGTSVGAECVVEALKQDLERTLYSKLRDDIARYINTR